MNEELYDYSEELADAVKDLLVEIFSRDGYLNDKAMKHHQTLVKYRKQRNG